MISLATLLGLTVLALIGRLIRRSGDRSDRLVAAAIACSLGLVAASVIVGGLSAPFSPWDMVRLAPSIALVRGINPYAGEHSGVVLSTMYGPVAILAYVPAALVGDSAMGAIIGRWLAFLFAFGPFVVCSRVVECSPDRAWRLMVLALGGFAMLLSPALRYSTTYLHADAPALGLTGLACLLAAKREGPGIAAAIVCGLAMLTKQTMLPLPIALFISAWFTNGRSEAIKFGAKMVAVIAVFAVMIVVLIDRQTLLLNLVRIPGGVPWRGRAPWNLLATTTELFVYAIPFLGVLVVSSKIPVADLGEERVSRVFLLASLMLAPMAILGRVKEAGDINSFSPCFYPLLLALTCRLACFGYRRTQTVFATVLTIIAIFASIRLIEDIRLLTKERPFRTETQYLAAHPNSVYFPWNPSAHLTIEGRPTHHLFSAWERGVAGFPVEHDHLISALPAGFRYVAFPLKRLGPTIGFGPCVQMLEQARLLDCDSTPVRLAGLPDYECYEILR